MPHRPLATVVLAALLIPAGHAASPPAPPWQGKLSPCTLPEGGGKAFCGTYEVFERVSGQLYGVGQGMIRTHDGEWWLIAPTTSVHLDEQDRFSLPVGPDCLRKHPEWRFAITADRIP